MEEKKKNRGGRPRGRAFSDQISIRIETYLVEYARRTGNLSRYINNLIRADYEKNELLKKEENSMKQIGNIMLPESGKEAFEIANASGKYEVERTLSGYYRLLCDDEVIHDDPAFEDVNEMESAYYFFAELIKEREG